MITFLQIIGGLAGLALLYYGADFLVKGGVNIATRLKITPLVIGLTLVAFATSAPELVVSVDAAIKGHGDISIGNVVGSNICNIALILGLCAMITPLSVNISLFKLDVPLMIIASIALSVCYYFTQGVNRIEAGFFLLGIILYTVWSVVSARRQENNKQIKEAEAEASKSIQTNKNYSLQVSIFIALGGIIALIIGAKLFVNSAVYIAQLFKVSDAIIGLTVVAIGTSLPELATSLVAAVKGEKDIAIGNIVGSNIFNILAILGVAPLISPISAPGISFVDMGMMIFTAVILYPIMKTGKVISRVEGAVLFVIYLLYTAWLIFF